MEQSIECILQWLNENACIAFFVSAGAMAMSLFVGVLSYLNKRKGTKLYKEQLKIQNRLLEIEQERDHEKQIQKQKAVLYAKIEEDTISSRSGHKTLPGYKLRIYNDGLAGARCIKTLIDEKPLAEYQYIRDDTKEIFEIEAESCISYPLQWTVTVPPEHKKRLNVKITWKDDMRQNKWEQIITP